LVPPPLGAFTGRPGVGRDRGCRRGGWTGQGSAVEFSAVAVGDDQPIRGPGEGEAAAVMQPVVERAEQHQVGQFGGAAVFPMLEVVGV
jgi:hypothetical protein